MPTVDLASDVATLPPRDLAATREDAKESMHRERMPMSSNVRWRVCAISTHSHCVLDAADGVNLDVRLRKPSPRLRTLIPRHAGDGQTKRTADGRLVDLRAHTRSSRVL